MMFRQVRLSFILGISVGVFLTMLFKELTFLYEPSKTSDLQEHELAHLPPISNDKPHEPIIFNDLDSLHHQDGDIIAKGLSRSVRVLCWVMTQPKTLYTKARAVKDTWGRRCNILVFVSSVEDKKFPAVGLDVPEGRDHLWLKTKAAWKYVYEKYFNDADWFIKADDDSFIILENLRYFLSAFNSSHPYYFGRHFTPFGGYNSGGAGYVFSKETLRRFIIVMKNPSRCRLTSKAEDMEVGKCLAAMSIHPHDTRDELGRETFHPFSPEHHLIPGTIPKDNWIHRWSKWPVIAGPDCCSDHSIAFHYIKPNRMYAIEYFVYHLHPYGIHHVHD